MKDELKSLASKNVVSNTKNMRLIKYILCKDVEAH